MPVSPAFVRSAPGRGCPVCTERRCADPAECLWFLTSRPWADCDRCVGTGWAGEDDVLSVFCRGCDGSGLVESGTDEITDNAKALCAAYCDALRARLATTPRLAVAA